MKKMLSLLLSLTLVGGLLSACGSATPSTAAKTPADSASAPVAEGKVITAMWNGTETDAVVQYYKQFVQDFNDTNEYGVTVEMQFYENEQYKTKLATLMASNNTPDIFFTWELDYLKPFVNGGKVLDLTDRMNAAPEFKDKFQEGVLEPLTYDGKLYGVPSQSTFVVMFYNKEIFEKNQVQVPTTWEDFNSVCQTLKANGEIPLCITAPDAWMPSQFIQQISNGVGGISWYEDLLAGTGQWNNEAFVQGGTIAQELIDKGYLQDGFLGMATEEGQQMMSDGKVAMYFMGIWDVSRYAAEDSPIKDKVGAFALPPVNGGNEGIYVGSVDSSLAISANTQYPDECFAFVQHWLSEKNQETLLYEAGRIPCTKIEIDESRVSPLMADCLEVSKDIKGLTPWLDRAFGAGEGVEFNNACQSVFGGEAPQTAFDNLAQYVQDNADN